VNAVLIIFASVALMVIGIIMMAYGGHQG